jgi:DNA-binding beta-propeller fold protein YncE
MRSVLFAAAGLVCLASPALPQQSPPQPDIPVVHYKAEAEWPKPPLGDKGIPTLWNYIQVAGVAVARNGNILVLHRGDNPILEFKPNGDLVGPWGKVKFDSGKVMPMEQKYRTPATSYYQAVYGAAGCSNCGAHEIRVDPQGNVWLVDSPAHVITKLDPTGSRVLMTMGTRGKPGMTARNFYLPTDIAFAPNGELVVTDGYGNARIMRFSADGRLLGEFGRRGDGPSEFRLPHNVVIDQRGRIYVSDRDNERVEVFDATGKFLTEWKHVGALSSLVITPDQKIWAGGVLRDLEGKALERLPGEGPNAQGHGGAVASNGDVYYAQLNGTMRKFMRQ